MKQAAGCPCSHVPGSRRGWQRPGRQVHRVLSAQVCCRTGRVWTYVRDDQPFGGTDPPAAVFFYSRDRGGEHPERHLDGYCGILQADAYAGFNALYKPERMPGPIIEAACWAHYLELDFIWSGWRRRQFWPMTSGRRAPDNTGLRVDIDGCDGDFRCRSRCIRRRAPRRTSRIMSGASPSCRSVRCTRRVGARLPVMAAIHG